MSLRAQLDEFDEPIKNQLRGAVRRVPPDLREDALQEARMQYLRALPRYDASAGASLQTFADRRIRGAVKDFLRVVDPLTRNQRRKVKAGLAQGIRLASPEAVALTADRDALADRGASPEDLAISAQAVDLIDLAKGRGRGVLAEMYLHDNSLTEAAEALGMKVSTTRHLKTAALRQIRDAIGLREEKTAPVKLEFL